MEGGDRKKNRQTFTGFEAIHTHTRCGWRMTREARMAHLLFVALVSLSFLVRLVGWRPR